MRKSFYSIIFLGLSFTTFSQQQQLKVAAIGFYNLENLFDTENDTLINDEEFLPDGENHWTEERYNEKLGNMAYAISQIGIESVSNGLSVLGVSEIENRRVLEDLVKQPAIANRKYQIVHYDSPDKRGIDVGLLYNPAHFIVDTSYTLNAEMYYSDGNRVYTRDVLVVEGQFDNEPMTFLVNHWPSRRGGEVESAPRRITMAKLNRKIVDSLQAINSEAKIVIMGDLNDDPNSPSLTEGLRAPGKKKDAKKHGLYNPMYDFFRRGLGSNAYRDNWSLFDQIIISEGLLTDEKGYHFLKANVFNKRFLIQKTGQYKDYPFRTFSFDTYQGGYSDHFPTYIYIVKEI